MAEAMRLMNDLFPAAVRLVVENQVAAAGFLNQRLGCGPEIAGFLMTALETAGIIAPGNGGELHTVLADSVEAALALADRQAVLATTAPQATAPRLSGVPGEVLEVLGDAAELVISIRWPSTAMLTRKLRIGDATAQVVMGVLEELKVVSAPGGDGLREVMVPEGAAAETIQLIRGLAAQALAGASA